MARDGLDAVWTRVAQNGRCKFINFRPLEMNAKSTCERTGPVLRFPVAIVCPGSLPPCGIPHFGNLGPVLCLPRNDDCVIRIDNQLEVWRRTLREVGIVPE
jgi:hypothetical protein